MYAKVIRVLLKGYLPISLLPPSKLHEMLGEVKKAIQITNPDYDIDYDTDYGTEYDKRLHLYYNMKQVTFGIEKGRILIVQFPIFLPALYTTVANIVSN